MLSSAAVLCRCFSQHQGGMVVGRAFTTRSPSITSVYNGSQTLSVPKMSVPKLYDRRTFTTKTLHDVTEYKPPTYQRSFVRHFSVSASCCENHRNPYDVLGVLRNASGDEVKAAYLAKTKQYHPDTTTEVDSQRKLIEVQEAYRQLRDKTTPPTRPGQQPRRQQRKEEKYWGYNSDPPTRKAEKNEEEFAWWVPDFFRAEKKEDRNFYDGARTARRIVSSCIIMFVVVPFLLFNPLDYKWLKTSKPNTDPSVMAWKSFLFLYMFWGVARIFIRR